MANEAICIETPSTFARYTVAEATAIPRFTLLKLSGDNTAIASSAVDVFAGIAWEEFKGGEGLTEITAALDGIWDLTNAPGGTITLGTAVCLSGANLIKTAAANSSEAGTYIGKALEAAAGGEVIRVRLGAI